MPLEGEEVFVGVGEIEFSGSCGPGSTEARGGATGADAVTVCCF